MNNLVTLKEFDPIRSADYAKVGLDENIVKRIIRFNEGQKKEIIRILANGVKATSYVGVFTAGKKTIQILPKISEGLEDKAIKNLLYMLAYTNHLEINEADMAKLCERKKADFFEVIIYLFSKNLLELLKIDFRKGYIEHDESLFFLRGKILFTQDAKVNLSRVDKTFCRYSDFSEDILLNQVFRYTAWVLLRLTKDPENYRILNELIFMLSDITPRRVEPSDFDQIHIDRLNRQYKPVVSLAKLFITNSSVELSNSELETFSFLFDMNALFEEFVAGYISKNKGYLVSENSKVIAQGVGRVKYLVDRPEAQFRLKPDIIIEKDGKKLIIDTKYKILDPNDQKLGVSQSDLYQVLAYALKFSCPNVVLLYPAHLQAIEKDYTIECEGKEIHVFVRCVDLRIDLQNQQKEMLDGMKKICKLIPA